MALVLPHYDFPPELEPLFLSAGFGTSVKAWSVLALLIGALGSAHPTYGSGKLAFMAGPYRLRCAETWAGNEGTSSAADVPGLRVWVHSRPSGSRTYLTALEQTSFMRALNEAAMVELDGVHYATMVAVGFHAGATRRCWR